MGASMAHAQTVDSLLPPPPSGGVIYLQGTNWIVLVDYKPKMVRIDSGAWIIVVDDKKNSK